jgi:short-subunit dehydrogenase
LVFDPTNKEELSIDIFSKMINVVMKRTKNKKLFIKLLVNNADKMSVNEIEKIEKHAKDKNIKLFKLPTPLNRQ